MTESFHLIDSLHLILKLSKGAKVINDHTYVFRKSVFGIEISGISGTLKFCR